MHAIDAVFQCHEHHRGVAILHPQMRDIKPLGGQRLSHLVSVLVLADNRHGGYRNAHSCKMDTPVNAITSRIEHADVLIDVRTAKTSRTRFNTHGLLQCSKGDPPHGEPPFSRFAYCFASAVQGLIARPPYAFLSYSTIGAPWPQEPSMPHTVEANPAAKSSARSMASAPPSPRLAESR